MTNPVLLKDKAKLKKPQSTNDYLVHQICRPNKKNNHAPLGKIKKTQLVN
jgi:hypothetical protein